MLGVSYTSAIGSIIYVMICTCPNISHIVNVVNKFMENPSKVYQQTVKQIFCYLGGIVDIGFIYDRGSS